MNNTATIIAADLSSDTRASVEFVSDEWNPSHYRLSVSYHLHGMGFDRDYKTLAGAKRAHAKVMADAAPLPAWRSVSLG